MATDDLQIHLSAKNDLAKELQKTLVAIAKMEASLREATTATRPEAKKEIEILSASLKDAQTNSKRLTGAITTLDREIEQLGGSASEAGRDLDRMNRESKTTHGRFSGVAAVGSKAAMGIGAVAAAAVGGAVALGKLNTAIGLYEQNRAKVRVVFAGQMREMKVWAKQHRDDFGGSTQDVLNYAASVQDLLIPMGFQRDEATKMTKAFSELVPVLTAWDRQGRTSAEITDIMAAALTGERESLKSLGVVINEEAVNAQVKLMRAKGRMTGATDEQATALATLELIYQKTGDAQDAYARNSDTVARRTKAMKAEVAQLRDNALSVLLTTWRRVARAFGMADLGSPITNLSRTLRQNRETIVSSLLTIGGVTAQVFQVGATWIAGTTKALGYLVGGFASVLEVMAFFNPEMRGAADRANAAAEAIGGFSESMFGVAGNLQDISTQLFNQADAASRAAGNTEILRQATKKLTKAQRDQLALGNPSIYGGKSGSGIPAVGDTSAPKGHGAGLGAAGLAAAHASLSAGGMAVTSGLRAHGLGSHDSDHARGRAIDVRGPRMGAYARAVRASGGYAAFHGEGANRHVHAVPNRKALATVSAAGDTFHAEVHVHGGNASQFNLRTGVAKGLRDAAQKRKERG